MRGRVESMAESIYEWGAVLDELRATSGELDPEDEEERELAERFADAFDRKVAEVYESTTDELVEMAEEYIREDPLSLEYRSGWVSAQEWGQR